MAEASHWHMCVLNLMGQVALSCANMSSSHCRYCYYCRYYKHLLLKVATAIAVSKGGKQHMCEAMQGRALWHCD